MAVKIKLTRLGKIRNPQYRISVADARTRRDGRAIEVIGRYHPKEDPSLIEIDSERAQYWLSVGAQPSETVADLLAKHNLIDPDKRKAERHSRVAKKMQQMEADKKAADEKARAEAEAAEAAAKAKAEAEAAAAAAKAAEAESAAEA